MRKKLVKIAVGLSGGVDSSVAALLLKRAGYDVTAVFLTCWSRGVGCSSEQDRKDAVAVAAQIGIPIRIWNFEREYQKRVIDRFYQEYKRGRTPNPDIWCNEEIKFGLFLEKALKELKVDYIATGHYARVALTKGATWSPDSRWHLLSGLDSTKDQSYFLYRLNQFQLSRTLFPVGNLTKQQVRKIAKQNNLLIAKKPDSQGICFVGPVDLKEFLKKRIKFHSGEVVTSDGRVIGRHEGVEFYTIGQRHGFMIDKYQGAPLYVIEKDIKNNRLIVGRDEESEVGEFEVEEVHWVGGKLENWKIRRLEREDSRIRKLEREETRSGNQIFQSSNRSKSNPPILQSSNLFVRIRHLGEFLPCQIKSRNSNLVVYLIKLTRGVAPGQHAVIYQKSKIKNQREEIRGLKLEDDRSDDRRHSNPQPPTPNLQVLGGGVIKNKKLKVKS